MGVFQFAQDDNGRPLNITLIPLLRRQLQQARQQGIRYHWVVIMAGVNDLGAGKRTAATIMPRLEEVSEK
jgi:lysophospholipase L1-like esterase